MGKIIPMPPEPDDLWIALEEIRNRIDRLEQFLGDPMPSTQWYPDPPKSVHDGLLKILYALRANTMTRKNLQ